jgi:hypothetical protein
VLQLFVFLQIDGIEQEEDCEIFIQQDCAPDSESWVVLRKSESRITGAGMRYFRKC